VSSVIGRMEVDLKKGGKILRWRDKMPTILQR